LRRQVLEAERAQEKATLWWHSDDLHRDLYQLPPVVTKNEKEVFKTIYESPYFYSAKVFDSMDFEFIELDKIYRQHDQRFIDLLGAIRNKTVTDDDLKLLNSRVMPDFEPDRDEFFVYLTTDEQAS